MENWKSVIDYEGLYEVSDLGRVRSLDREIMTSKGIRKYKGVNIKPHKRVNRLTISLNKQGNAKTRLISQLVAEAFLGHVRCGHDLIVDHINNNPLDDKLINLQIITSRENHSKDKKRKLPTGVVPSKRKKNPFRAQITIDGKNKHIGNFPTVELADLAYKNKVLTLKNNSQ